jgi:sugar O-acyltransferase (sialic acid O-acetyltransferase NeuD family)
MFLNFLKNNSKQEYAPLVIYGAGSNAECVASIALTLGYKIKCFIDDDSDKVSLIGCQIEHNLNILKDSKHLNFVISPGHNFDREKIFNKVGSFSDTLKFPNLIHPTAVISNNVRFGFGNVVMPNSVIGPNSKLGNFCIINTHSSIDHDCKLNDYSSIGPGVVTGGNVTLGKRSYIAIGATIKNNIDIGNDCIVGAKSYLNTDLIDETIAYGIPAKKIKSRKKNDRYL